jgi:hypothetical protein
VAIEAKCDACGATIEKYWNTSKLTWSDENGKAVEKILCYTCGVRTVNAAKVEFYNIQSEQKF